MIRLKSKAGSHGLSISYIVMIMIPNTIFSRRHGKLMRKAMSELNSPLCSDQKRLEACQTVQYKAREHYDDNWSTQSTALYKFMHSSLSTLYTRVNGAADLCLRLFIACGQIADQTGFEEVSYEFFAQAYMRRLSVTREHNFRLYASLPVRFMKRGTSARRIMIH